MRTGRAVFGVAALIGVVATATGARTTLAPKTTADVEPPEPEVDPEARLHALALLDSARQLTPTEVALDERARDHWLPLVGEIQAAATDPATDSVARELLVATLARLDQVGL